MEWQSGEAKPPGGCPAADHGFLAARFRGLDSRVTVADQPTPLAAERIDEDVPLVRKVALGRMTCMGLPTVHPSRDEFRTDRVKRMPGQSLTRLAVNVTLLSSPTFRPLPASQMIVSPGKTTFEKSVFSTFASVTWYGSR